jgi:DnaJ-class molecular chaperone
MTPTPCAGRTEICPDCHGVGRTVPLYGGRSYQLADDRCASCRGVGRITREQWVALTWGRLRPAQRRAARLHLLGVDDE